MSKSQVKRIAAQTGHQPEEMKAWFLFNDYMEAVFDMKENAFVVIGTQAEAETKAAALTVEQENRGMPKGYATYYVVGPIEFAIAIKP